jgi:hypothetical protein
MITRNTVRYIVTYKEITTSFDFGDSFRRWDVVIFIPVFRMRRRLKSNGFVEVNFE